MKTISLKDAVALIPDGASLMIGGFMGVGTPERVIDELVRQEKRNLTVIANDTAMPGRGIGKLVTAGLISRTIASHIGLNPEAQQQMIASRMVVELVPQGTLIERIRAGGFGLGGILTPTGVGTVVEEGKRRIDLDGKSFLLETALRANFALVICTNRAQLQSGDRNGSGHGHCYGRTHRTSRRYRSRSRGDASPRCRLPRGQRVEPMDAQTVIARRIAQELREGMLVNLGIGIPTLVANYVPEGVSVFFQTENGLIGTGPIPEEGMAPAAHLAATG